MSFDIPAGLTDLLQDFTVSVLRERPSDLVAFAATYFNNLNGTINSNNVKAGGGEPVEDQEHMQTDSDTYSDEEPFGNIIQSI